MKRILCSVLCVAMLATTFMFTANAQSYRPEVEENSISFDFNYVVGGITNKDAASIQKNVEKEGVNAVMVIPTPNNENATGDLTIDCWSLHKYEDKVIVPEYRYVGVTYYYETSEPVYDGQLYMRILPGAYEATATLSKRSQQTLVANQWTEVVFNFSDVMKLSSNATEPWINQVHFRPFDTTPAKEISAKDRFYIAKYTFYKSNPDPDARATIRFDKGTPEASGEMPSMSMRNGEAYEVPECTFVYPDAEFRGWKVDGETSLIQPGAAVVSSDINRTYTAVWKVTKDVAPTIAVDFASYQAGVVDHEKTATLENVVFEGKNVLKITPHPDFDIDRSITIDGFKYQAAGIDIKDYQYCAIEYYYESEKPLENAKMYAAILPGGNIVNSRVSVLADQPLVEGVWTYAIADFSQKLQKGINYGANDNILRQFWVRPFGDTIVQNISAGDVMYIGRLIFFNQKPNIETHEAYMNGYTDGTFGVNGNMTRAEACTVVARLLEAEENIAGVSNFADVPADQWYAKYIGYCAEKGLLNSYSGQFFPNQPITRAEFAELVYLTGLAEATDNIVAFADVNAGHAKYASIVAAASAGLINGYDNGNGTFSFRPDNTITRAEVVTIINRARGRDMKLENLPDDVLRVAVDVDVTHWAFANISEATVAHVELEGNWIYPVKDPLEMLAEKIDITPLYNIPLGNAKVAELDALEAQRIAEIQNTPNMDLSGITGKIIYVSSSAGDDSRNGLTPSTAVKTIKKANTLVEAGGAVLLKRGDIWREKTNALAGVTYTAYGEGAKPIISGSPENGADPEKWALVYKNDETGALIWQYQNTSIKDVGTIVFNNEGYAYKELPLCLGKTFMLKGGIMEFDYRTALDRNLEFFHAANSVVSNIVIGTSSTGPIYLRCDEGNPGKIFDSIEFNERGHCITVGGDNVTIDNIRMVHAGGHGVGAGTVKNLAITNCEIGWIGGSIQIYQTNADGYGEATRYGNGVEVFGSCDGYIVDNCYIWQCYDAGVTHQISNDNAGDYHMDNITYSNNVITDTVYSIEYFLGNARNGLTYSRNGKNVLFEGNLLRRAGYGFGSTRPDGKCQRHIHSWNYRNEFENFVIKNNVFDRSVYELFNTYSGFESTVPKMEGNTYVQGVNNIFYHYGATGNAMMNLAADASVKLTIGDTTGSVYFVENIPDYKFGSYTVPKTVAVTEDDTKSWAK